MIPVYFLSNLYSCSRTRILEIIPHKDKLMKLSKARKIIRSRRVSISQYENCLAEYKQGIFDAIENAAADYPCINYKFNFELPIDDVSLNDFSKISDDWHSDMMLDVLPLSELPIQYLKSDIYQLQEELKLLNKIILIVDTELEKLSINE